ncbi:DUF6768 family protein [uncultured Erythrobacter sp.]|uniref:DUF6768 family protein n=1 Tax=uncultured Erythrobacter sp. TaxID=263913 RepID=UPI00260D0B7C|nr:DUF6768 family protein [uncultured Erythrobacter sp.]
MAEIDDKISEALDQDDYAFLTNLDADRGMFQQIGDTWKGPLGGWAKLLFGFTFVLGMGLLYAFYQVAHTRHPVEHTLWAILALTLIVLMGFAKEWMFARMNMLTILREIKRLQVQVALLSEEQQQD